MHDVAHESVVWECHVLHDDVLGEFRVRRRIQFYDLRLIQIALQNLGKERLENNVELSHVVGAGRLASARVGVFILQIQIEIHPALLADHLVDMMVRAGML